MMKEKILNYKKRQITYTIIEWMCIVLPFAILCLCKKDTYFYTTNDKISCTLGFVLGAFTVILAATNKVPKQKGIFYYIVAVLLVWLFKSCVSDLRTIITISFVGYAISLVFQKLANKNGDLFKQYKQALINQDVCLHNDGATLDEKGDIR